MFTFDDGTFQDSKRASEREREREQGGGGVETDLCLYFLFVHQLKITCEFTVGGVLLHDSVTRDRHAKRLRSSTIRVIGEWNFVSFRFKWIFFNFIFFSSPCSCWYCCWWWCSQRAIEIDPIKKQTSRKRKKKNLVCACAAASKIHFIQIVVYPFVLPCSCSRTFHSYFFVLPLFSAEVVWLSSNESDF